MGRLLHSPTVDSIYSELHHNAVEYAQLNAHLLMFNSHLLMILSFHLSMLRFKLLNIIDGICSQYLSVNLLNLHLFMFQNLSES